MAQQLSSRHRTPPSRAPVAMALAASIWLLSAATVNADWHLGPFIGAKFGGGTNLVLDLEKAGGQTRLVYGGDATYLGPSIFGVEIDFAYVPGYFKYSDAVQLVNSSSVMTLMGNVVVALPTRITRESLRPFVSGGMGLIRPRIDDVHAQFPVDRTLLGMNVGGGIVGFLTKRTGLRWEIRHFRVVKGEDAAGTFSSGSTRLSFWRGTMGLVIRY